MTNQSDSIILIGPMGSGKTSSGRILAKEMGYRFADTDEEVVQRTGVSIAYIFDVEGEDGFRVREHEALKRLIQKKDTVVATGGGIVGYSRSRIIIQERKNVVYLKTSIDKQIERATVSDNRPLLIDTDPASKLEELMLTREPLYEEISDIKIDTDKSTPREIALEIIDKLV
jgi:shikimate kinase|tara:strand:- start:1770 stop:2285 length:516 start_codon:yes stop_codon:yes gene_type:complete